MKRRGYNVCRDVTQLTLLASGLAMSAEVQHLKQTGGLAQLSRLVVLFKMP